LRRLFLDSSALAKRYVRERGTERVNALCGPADEVVLSVLCLPECVSAFLRLARENLVTRGQYRALMRDLLADLEQATVIDLHPEVLAEAVRCLETARVRALDAVHIGSAAVCGFDPFVTSDRRQRDAAHASALKVELV
jgi:predicted nucleic acid-binding protein